MGNRTDELIAQVDLAFHGVTLGDGIGLWESDGIDDYCGSEELRDRRAKDEKLDWRRIPVDDLIHCNAAPSFLDARGLYFHLPAFMTAELHGELMDDFAGRLIYDSFVATAFRQLLTPEQRHVIIAYISFYGAVRPGSYAEVDIAQAILRYSTE